MRRNRTTAPWVAACLALALAGVAACETEPAADPAGESGGVGPSTLLVRATLTATNRVTNATAADDFDTTVQVTVERDGAAVPDAIVALRRADREAPDVLLPDESNRYVGDHVGYVDTYELSVEAGPDTLTGVRILMPEVHSVTAPAPAARIPAAAPLAVSWAATDAVDQVTVALGAAQVVVDDDPGAAEVPAAALANLTQDGAAVERALTVKREVRLALEGGAAGSRATAAVVNGLGAVTVTP